METKAMRLSLPVARPPFLELGEEGLKPASARFDGLRTSGFARLRWPTPVELPGSIHRDVALRAASGGPVQGLTDPRSPRPYVDTASAPWVWVEQPRRVGHTQYSLTQC